MSWSATLPFFVFLAVGAFEHLATWRLPRTGLGSRWIVNLSLEGTNWILPYFILPTGVVGVALYANKAHLGLLTWLHLPGWVQVMMGVLLLDAGEYFLHRLSHGVHILWRLHAVHHADLDVDATTSFRHHPLEVLADLCLMGLCVAALGIPAAAVVIYQQVSILSDIAQHGNFRLPLYADSLLRCFLITPNVHRIHHSRELMESNRNYGSVLIWWDKLFGTYQPFHYTVDTDLHFGLDEFADARDLAPLRVLAIPFLIRHPSPPDPFAAQKG
jgi:sterol desaturase/sphingolipid hydroxylase (fatty acid hydroxylase superfamily)